MSMTSQQNSSPTGPNPDANVPQAGVERSQENENYQSLNHHEQEIKSMKVKLAELEEQKAEKMKSFNEERSNLESQLARLRAQVERGEAIRQNLEYELTLAKKATNQVKRIAVEKEAETSGNVALLKEQISELKTKFSEVEQDLIRAKNQRDGEKEQFEKELQHKETEIKHLTSRLESSQKESNRLHQIVQEQQNSMVELQEKCTSLEAQRQSQNNTLRHQAKDLEYGVEREERLKKELEQSRGRVKNLEEHVEAERASHLETKFNSEIVQLRVRDLEGDLEVKNTALDEAVVKVEMLTERGREFEEGFNKEREKCQELSSKLKQLHDKYSCERKRTKEDLDDKQSVIAGLSKQLEIHQKNFDLLKKELNQAKKHQSEFDQNYRSCLKELGKLVETYGKSKSSKNKTGRNKDRLDSSQSSALIDDIRRILLEYETTRTNAINEAKKLNIMVENLSRENDGYQKLMWSRDQAVEDVKQAAKSVKRELSEVRVELANKDTVCAGLEVEIQTLKQHLDEERRNCEKLRDKLDQTKNQHITDDQTRLSFLHTIYQCLVSGQFHKTQPGDSYETFSWDDMMRLLLDQIGNHISELNRAKEKVAHLEEVLNGKERHIKQTQENHEVTIKKLSATLKEREHSWEIQSKELEDHFGNLITDLHFRVQKTQEMADESWQKVQETNAANAELETQNKTLKNSRKKYIKEKTALLASCALLSGTLWPAVNQIEVLKRHKRILTSMTLRLSSLQEHARFLCETLSYELSGVTGTPLGSVLHCQSGRVLLLKFRVGVVAILALNRLLNFTLRRRTSIVVSEGPVGGLDATLVVHCGRSTEQTVEFRGLGGEKKCLNNPSLSTVSPAWFSNERLLSHAVDSMNDLCEKISKRDDRDASRSWSPNSCVTVARTAKRCYEKLLKNLRTEFDDGPDASVSIIRRQSNNLILVLGNGLRRCIGKLRTSERHRYVGAEELINNLQNFVLGLSQRLHKVEVERRDLSLEFNRMRKENDELKRATEKRQLDSQQVYKDIEDMREKLSNTVPRSQFENIYSELSNALEREKQAQSVLNKQAAQLKDMERRLDLISNNNEQSEATLAEAIKDLSEAKMELRRKEQNVRQVTKDSHLTKNEKKLLQEKLNDAEKAMTEAARERETVLRYLKGIQQGLEQNKASLKQSSQRRSFTELSSFLITEGKLTNEGCPLGPTILACQNVVNGFLEVHQQTLVLLSQLEAEKQQAQMKISSLETEINSHRSHINTLKDELAAACRRQFNDEEFLPYGRSSMEHVAKPYRFNGNQDFSEERESESYTREFVPLMRYDSISPVKSLGKQEKKTQYPR